jgi:hypothetical protein
MADYDGWKLSEPPWYSVEAPSDAEVAERYGVDVDEVTERMRENCRDETRESHDCC